MTRRLASRYLAALAVLALGACGGEAPSGDEQDFSSNQATLLRFEFDAEFVTSRGYGHEQMAEDQLLYTIGHLNGHKAVGRLDTAVVSRVEVSQTEDGKNLVRYHAVLPVGWGSKTNLPESYEFTLPRNMDELQAFSDKYGRACVDSGAHDIEPGNLWYYYRPNRSGCSLEAGDVVKTTATATVSPENTSGKYPEYDKVWEDDALKVVAIFGKYEDNATSPYDAGISAYDRFVGSLGKEVGVTLRTEPEGAGSAPGVDHPHVAFRGELPDGRKVEVDAILVDNVSQAGPEFDAIYEPLSTEADIIFYNGHAGLGQNVRALAKKGTFRAGKYQIFFMNGCDTFAYVDGSLAETRAALNPDDPTGTKYMEIVTNLLPSFFSQMPRATFTLMKGLLSYDAPKTYDEIFDGVDDAQVVVVTGEEDNAYAPEGESSGWEGLSESGEVARGAWARFELPELPAGTYRIATSGEAGDVDLYVGLGREPSEGAWDYRPYKDGSDEEVVVKLEKPTKLFLGVLGYADESSAFSLVASPAGG